MNRRQFLEAARAAACGCAACPVLALYAADACAAGEAREVDVGPLEDYARAGVYDLTKRGHPFFVVNRKGRLYAVSSTCTHKRVTLKAAKDGNGFKCPRHGSLFDVSGKVTKAPARKSLPRYAIRLDASGTRVLVDTSMSFGPSDWDDPAASVELKAE